MSKKIVLKLRVPKLNERGPIAFEQILASLHGLLLKQFQQHKDENITFEIANIKGHINFFIVAPYHLRTLVTSQVYSQYPDVEISEYPDYLVPEAYENKETLVMSFAPGEPWVFPFKRHPQFEDRMTQSFQDPLGPITSAISHLHSHQDSAVIQFVVTPIGPKWNTIAKKTLRRFWGGRPWSWDWWRALYQKHRLGFTRKERIKNFWAWGGMLMLCGWGKLANPEEMGMSEQDKLDQQLDREERTSSRHDNETSFGACFDKLSRLNFAVNIRALYLHSDPDPFHAAAKLREVAGTFQQFSQAHMNAFTVAQFDKNLKTKLGKDFIGRLQDHPFALSQEELATMYHLPTETVKTPGIDWIVSRTVEPPKDLPMEGEEDVTLIGKTNFRNSNIVYGMRPEDRLRHCYIIGKTGMGKSTLLENMIISDIMEGKGVGVVDPHGDLIESIISLIPKSRTNDVILFDPSDSNWPIAFNLLEGKNQAQRSLIASGLIGVIKKLNIDSWGPRLEHFLRNTILALVEAPDTTMLGITRMLVDKNYRAKILQYVEDPMVRSFWETEFSALAPAKLAEAVGPIQNKVGQFLATPIIRNIIGQPKSTLDIRGAMDSGKIILVNLSKGKIGEDNTTMMGSMLITKFQIDAMSRADVPEKDRKPFMLYIDEFQNFATDSFATILSEARKYKLSLTMANQYIAQMSEEVAAAVFGNVGSLISFQVGIDDAKIMSEQFDEEVLLPNDLIALPKYAVYNRIMVDGLTSPVFSAWTLPPAAVVAEEDPAVRMEKVRNFSRQRYGRERDKVEDKIMRWARAEESKKDVQRKSTKGQESSDKKEPKNQKAKGSKGEGDKKLPLEKGDRSQSDRGGLKPKEEGGQKT
ncbi:MAG TPA: type IV secretion system DNA-binding domain-containing protein [Candidatus Gracilibacteria bacterium]